MRKEGGNIDVDLVNNVFRAAHSIKGGAGFMGLDVIKNLAHHLENVLDMVRNKELVPDAPKISVLLNGFLLKPIVKKDLSQKIREVLGEN